MILNSTGSQPLKFFDALKNLQQLLITVSKSSGTRTPKKNKEPKEESNRYPDQDFNFDQMLESHGISRDLT